MFTSMAGFPDNVVAVRGEGRVSGDDYKAVLAPAVERATAGGRKARLLIELGAGCDGYDPSAMLADASLGMGHMAAFERIAVVTDTDRIRRAIQMFGPIIPGDVRLFSTGEAGAARAWIVA